jgi:hypothetical protein
MSPASLHERQRKRAYEFVANVFGMTGEDPEGTGESVPPGREFSAATPRKNEPEFWADAPWRIEPDWESLPVLFIIRDGDIQPPGKGPWRLAQLRVEQRLTGGAWHEVCAFAPSDLPNVDAEGNIGLNFWTHSTEILLSETGSPCNLDLDEVRRGGDPLHLRAVFIGSFCPYDKIKATEIHLEIQLAEHALPQGRAACGVGPRTWFYGDTHYHSAYTNDVKEFGGPVPETRDAGSAIGLDWLMVTDHSCDLDTVDDGTAGVTRWQRLKDEVGDSDLSDDSFRLILGEEITLRGGDGERYVHMLAFGAMDDMVEGGFLPDEEGGFMTRLFKEAIEELIEMAIRDGGYHPDTGKQLFGPVHTFDHVMNTLPDGALAFAAHPYAIAQPPFINCDWAQEDLDDPRLCGHEFWNGRSRRSALLTDDPFSKPSWTDPGTLGRKDRTRIEKLKKHVEKGWDAALRRGVDEWLPGDGLPVRRPVFVAGSDAHGSFNYSVGWGWDYEKQFQINDNALGRARTAIHLPDHGIPVVPDTADILAALKKGACVVTDGPLLEFSVAHHGSVAHMGELLTVDSESDVEITVVAHTNAEFGNVEQVEVVTYGAHPPSEGPSGIAGFLGGLWGKKAKKTKVRAGQRKTINLKGAQGFCRIQAQTEGPAGERFCCFTNPIWLRITDGNKARLRIELSSAP